jgi:hypothetical protein
VVLNVRHALLLAVIFNGLGSFYACAVGLQIGPWRSALVGLSAGTVLALVLQNMGLSQMPVSILVALLPAIIAVTVELWHHRTYVQGGALVVQHGVLGNLRESFPISELREVHVSYPFLGRFWNVGDLNVLGDGWGTTLPAVRSPQECARRLVALRDKSAARRGDSRGN